MKVNVGVVELFDELFSVFFCEIEINYLRCVFVVELVNFFFVMINFFWVVVCVLIIVVVIVLIDDV